MTAASNQLWLFWNPWILRTDFDSGTNGLPSAQTLAADAHGSSVTDGVITIVWKTDGTSLSGVTYTLTAQGILPPIQWVSGGTCVAAGYC